MAATVVTRVYTGATPDEATTTTIRFYNADRNPDPADVSNPCVRPGNGGPNYSFWKTIALYATTSPDVCINNVKLYTDSALAWTGCTVYVGDDTTDIYQQATGSGNSGDEMVATHGQIDSKTDLFTYTQASPMDISGSLGYAAGRISDFVVLQSAITSGASPGVMPTETLTWIYDEV